VGTPVDLAALSRRVADPIDGVSDGWVELRFFFSFPLKKPTPLIVLGDMTMAISVRLFLLSISLLFVPPLTAAEAPASSHLQAIQKAGKIVLRCFPDQQNRFLRVNTAQGAMPQRGEAKHFEGIDVEVLTRVAAILGVRLEIEPIAEPSLTLLLDEVATGHGDLAGGGLTTTQQREARFTLSRPYFQSSDLMIVLPTQYPTPAELWRSRAALLRGSSFDDALLTAGYPKERAHYVDFTIDTFGLVLDGEAGFTFADSVSLPEALLKQFRVAYRFGDPHPMVYLLPKGSDLKAPLDRALQQMEASGELAAILKRYQKTALDLTTIPHLDPATWCQEGC
jgi:ABC-type amino acid transport substrate-binding protein